MPPITDISQLDLTKRYPYADYVSWQFDEFVELIRGKVSRMSPALRVRHQRISFNLGTSIGLALRGKSCQGFAAPCDVRLTKTVPNGDAAVETVVQPDLCVFCDPAKLDECGCVGAPDWIIKILSPGSTGHDSKTKFDLCEENGVTEYWLVDPGLKNVAVYVLENEEYIIRGEYCEPGLIPVATLPGLALEWHEVFEGV
ncbi:Uma2 family endonuclease [Hymenobacter sp. BT491]|uniref:Uma2 family endonuclease n=1 Tax=Hymenobacter sp. BT491 TaxID=2766779 RepID=UPI0016535B4F|nr:Uma2 family endonuclease [Hymenobacter sp. BT491]MBC6988178.1 Uma2 family endonuclease [Hymenobacter sp. BT491]